MAKTEREEGHMIGLDIYSSDKNMTNNFGLVNYKWEKDGSEIREKPWSDGRHQGGTLKKRLPTIEKQRWGCKW